MARVFLKRLGPPKPPPAEPVKPTRGRPKKAAASEAPSLPLLGRHIEHDSRSRDYAYRLPVTPVVHRTIIWPNDAGPLDQGKTSSCTGNAMAGLINSTLFSPVRKAKSRGLLAEPAALHFYGLATHLDGFGPDQYYPPNDDGSSGLAVAKAAQQLGYIDRYQHCFTFGQLQAALQTQPVIVGTTWTNLMFQPDSNGFVSPGNLNDPSNVAGGHEYLCQGIDYERQALVFLNSWGPGWGAGASAGLSPGQFRISFNDFQALLANQGDVTVPHGVGLP